MVIEAMAGIAFPLGIAIADNPKKANDVFTRALFWIVELFTSSNPGAGSSVKKNPFNRPGYALPKNV